MPEVAGVWLRVRSRATFVHAPLLWTSLTILFVAQHTKTGHQMVPLCDRSVPSPNGWRGSRDAVNPSCHMGLVGKTGFHRDPAQALGSSGNAKPGRARSQFRPQNGWCDAVRRRESPGYCLACQTVNFRPHPNFGGTILSQMREQQIWPIIALPR